MTLARFLGRVGRVLITAGVLILSFVAYQLWGTGLQTARAQNQAEDEFAQLQEDYEESQPDATTTTTASPDSTAPTTEGPEEPAPIIPPAPGEGGIVGKIEIPSIGVDWIFYEGVDLGILKDGPGHYMGTPLPGQPGNAAIAGHRTTYGAPFHRLDEMQSGDEITVTYISGAEFTYEYRSTEIVNPNQTEILQDKNDNRLTLTACHPKYSARERIVVIARLKDPPAEVQVGSTNEGPLEITFDSDEGGEEEVSGVPAVLWGIAAAMIWLAAYFVGRAWRKWPSYFLAFPLFALALFIFFENFYALLPAGY